MGLFIYRRTYEMQSIKIIQKDYLDVNQMFLYKSK